MQGVFWLPPVRSLPIRFLFKTFPNLCRCVNNFFYFVVRNFNDCFPFCLSRDANNLGFSAIFVTQNLYAKSKSHSSRNMQINCDYLIMQSSINDILTVKTKSLQTFGRELHLYAYWLDIKYYQFIVKLGNLTRLILIFFFIFQRHGGACLNAFQIFHSENTNIWFWATSYIRT